MRILIVHPGVPFSQHDVWNGWDKAFRAQGHRVVSYRTDERLRLYAKALPRKTEAVVSMAQMSLFSQAFITWPELVFFVGTSYMTQQVLTVLKARGMKIAVLHTESPYEDARQLAVGAQADVNFINDPINLASWEALGKPVRYIPHSYDPDVHYPADTPKTVDLAFIGTALPSRREFFDQMPLDGLASCIDGGGWTHAAVFNSDAADLYRESACGINFYRREGETTEGLTMGPREIEMAACGLPFARDPREENSQILPFLPSFTNPVEAREAVDWLLADEERRASLGARARLAIADRTFDNAAVKAMKLMELAGIC